MTQNPTAFEYYKRDIEKYKSNDQTENKVLEKMYREGDETAREKLINGNLKLVLYVVNQYEVSDSIDLMDLVQQGNIGLIEAIESHDPERSALSTYIVLRVKRRINRYLYEQSKTIRKPEWQQLTTRKINELIDSFSREYGYTPTPEYIAMKLNVPERTVDSILKDNAVKLISLDSPIGEDGDTLQDFIPDNSEPNLSSNYKRAIQTALNHLSFEDRELIENLYGLNGKQQKSMEEYGRMHNTTKQNISQKYLKILSKLRHPDILKEIRKQL